MPRPSFEREAIEAEIGRVRSLGVDALRTLWRTTFRSSPPPAFSKDILARYLCWGIQEQAFGGLDPKTAKNLDGLARGDRSPADRSRRLKPGTVLLREYQGELARDSGTRPRQATVAQRPSDNSAAVMSPLHGGERKS